MKKLLWVVVVLLFWTSSVFWYTFDEHTYLQESINRFIHSPNAEEIAKISDWKKRYCEQVYLEANHRREYTQEELYVCRDIFAIKNEDEINYMRYVLGERGVE